MPRKRMRPRAPLPSLPVPSSSPAAVAPASGVGADVFDPEGIAKYVDHRAALVERCAKWVGFDDPTVFWKEVLHAKWQGPFPKHWCGAFVLANLRWEMLTTWLWEIPKVTPGAEGSGFLFRLAPKWQQVSRAEIEPGDVCYLDVPYQHHAIVERVVDGIVHTIDGNQGKPGVQRREHRANDRRWAHYSIKHLLPVPPEPQSTPPGFGGGEQLSPGLDVEGAEP